jgi:hypothetical protein
MIRMTVLALVALSTPALAGCPDCILQPEPHQSEPYIDPFAPLPWEQPYAAPVRRSYQPTYQEPIEEPRRPISSYELDNAIRQIPGWNKQFPNYGR